MEEKYSNIIKYLNKQLKGEELVAFEQLMEEDEDFAREVRFHQKVIKAQSKKIFEQNLGEFMQEKKNAQQPTAKHRFLNGRSTLMVAASLTLFLAAIAAFLWQNATLKKAPTLEQLTFQTPLDVDSLTNQYHEDRTRMGLFEKSQWVDSAIVALEYYQKGNYTLAIPKMQAYLSKYESDYWMKYQLAICQLNVQAFNDAEANLISLSDREGLSLFTDAQLRLVGLYLWQERLKEAQKQLEAIQPPLSQQQEQQFYALQSILQEKSLSDGID